MANKKREKIDANMIQSLLNDAQHHFGENKLFFQNLKKIKKSKLDDVFRQFHEEVFEELDCLDCANCCKTTSPRLFMVDIERVSKANKISSRDFIDSYLSVDEDHDYIFKNQPCPFLDADNYCNIYRSRPTACKEYPHTNRKRMYQILEITLNNTLICPAVYLIVEKAKLVMK